MKELQSETIEPEEFDPSAIFDDDYDFVNFESL
jgi:hypothetical protein